ncbi:hypothetical protein [Azospirillum sp. ST 5-10]|uniref:hypothetical protein n=1 Tax=unclassified Azospirillum TaxID=2630922 RepID=UPI003F4A19F3
MSAMAIDSSTIATGRPPAAAAPLQAPNGNREEPAAVAESDLSFWDFLDVINPLQHIPVIGSVYRAVTGDQIGGPARVMGGILFGGVIGGAVAVANAVLEDTTGKDAGDHMLVAMGLEDDGEAATATAVAAAPGAAGPAAANAAGPATANAAGPATAGAAATAVADAAGAGAAAGPGPQGAAPAKAAMAAMTETAARPAATVGRGHDPFAAAPGEHRPSRMPARDTILANTAQARHAAALAQGRTAASAPVLPAMVPAATAPAVPAAPAPAAAAAAPAPAAAAAAATAPAPDAAFPQPVSKEALSEVMLRNLAKYEQARKAAQRAPAGVEVSG